MFLSEQFSQNRFEAITKFSQMSAAWKNFKKKKFREIQKFRCLPYLLHLCKNFQSIISAERTSTPGQVHFWTENLFKVPHSMAEVDKFHLAPVLKICPPRQLVLS